eukprot:jgi/Ulvmu1/9332/UM050_0082.1
MGKEAEVHIPVPKRSPLTPKRRPFIVASDVLNPTLCLSNVGLATGKSFSPALVSPSKVHTSLISMLIANEMTEEMISELLGTGNAAPLMKSLIQPGTSGIVADKSASADAISRAAGVQQAGGSPSTMRRLVPASAAVEQEASGAARIVRAKHLPEHVLRKYGPPDALHRPRQVRSIKHIFAPAPPCAVDVTGATAKGLAQRAAGHSSASAAGNPHAAAAMAMAQQALRRERHRAAAASASSVQHGERRGATRSARRPLSASARLQAGLGGIATAPFVSTGRSQATNVGYNVTRTGAAAEGTPGPAAYRPQWLALRPHSAAATVCHRHAVSAGRHREAAQSPDTGATGGIEAQPGASLTGRAGAGEPVAVTRGPATASVGAASPSDRRSHGGGLDADADDGPNSAGMHAAVYARCGPSTRVHPPAEPLFPNAAPGNSASFKATTRAAATGRAGAAAGSTVATVGPGAYEPDARREVVALRQDGVAWGAPRPILAPACGPMPQQRRHVVPPGPGAYEVCAAEHGTARPRSKGCDFARGSWRPGSAPHVPAGQHAASAVRAGMGVPAQHDGERHASCGESAGGVGAGGGGALRGDAMRAVANAAGAAGCGAGDAREDDPQEFIYDDDDDDCDGLDWGGAGDGGAVLAAVEGARSAADVRAALQKVGAGGSVAGRPPSARPRLWSGSRSVGATEQAGSAGRLRSRAYQPETIRESPDIPDSEAIEARPAVACAGGAREFQPRRRPVSAADVHRSVYAALCAEPSGPAGCQPRAQSAGVLLSGRGAARCASAGRQAPADTGLPRAGQDRASGVLAWGSAGSHGLVTERPVSAFSNPDMAAEAQRIDWHAARRRAGPRSAPAAPQAQHGRMGPARGHLGGQGLTALSASSSAPVSAHNRGTVPQAARRPYSSPLLKRNVSKEDRVGSVRPSEGHAKGIARRSQIKGITMAKSTRSRVSVDRGSCVPQVWSSQCQHHLHRRLMPSTTPCTQQLGTAGRRQVSHCHPISMSCGRIM